MDGIDMRMNFSGADMRCIECNRYLPDRCTCNGISIEEQRIVMGMSHGECYTEIQDEWVPEEELNSEDFETKYSRLTLAEIRAEVIRHRNSNPTKITK